MHPNGLLSRNIHPASLLVVAGIVLGLSAGMCGPSVAVAQTPVQTVAERRGPTSPQERADLYAQLDAHAKILQTQAAVVKTVAKLIGPTVVHIEADVSGRSVLHHGPGNHVEEAGSGVIVQLDGKYYVLTNRHVVSGAPAEKIDVNLADGRMIHPQKVWGDEQTDAAVMAVSAPDLVAAKIGDSDAMQIGDFVLAVGSPFGLSYSVTFGIISAKGRRGLQLGTSGVRLQDFIQTDAAINPGNSGGPLVNLRGEIIGLNTAIASNSGGSEGIGFAIPVNMFMVVSKQLIERGSVRRAYLGVTLDPDFTPVEATKAGLPGLVGARVMQVTANSPAATGKLQRYDVILQIGGVAIEDDNHLVNVINFTEVGKEVPLVVLRDKRQLEVNVVLADGNDF